MTAHTAARVAGHAAHVRRITLALTLTLTLTLAPTLTLTLALALTLTLTLTLTLDQVRRITETDAARCFAGSQAHLGSG
jgi:hypothetical protein